MSPQKRFIRVLKSQGAVVVIKSAKQWFRSLVWLILVAHAPLLAVITPSRVPSTSGQSALLSCFSQVFASRTSSQAFVIIQAIERVATGEFSAGTPLGFSPPGVRAGGSAFSLAHTIMEKLA